MSQLRDQIIAKLDHSFFWLSPDSGAFLYSYNLLANLKPGQLGGHVVDGADENAVPLESDLVLVLVGVVQAEGLVDRGALVHELNGTAWVRGDVADCHETRGKVGAAWRRLDPGD